MATVRGALSLYDGMTQPLQHIHNALVTVIDSFEAMQAASGNSVDVSALQQAREELAKAGANMEDVESRIRQADQAQDQFNDRIREGTTAADGLGNKLKSVLTVAAAIGTVKMGLNWAKENMELANIQRNAENQLKAVLANMGAQEIEVPVTADTQPATTAIEGVSTALSKLDGVSTQVAVEADTGAAKLDLDRLSNSVTNYTETLTLNTAGALDSYSNFADVVNGAEFGNSYILNTDDAINRMNRLNGALPDDPITATMRMNTKQATGAVAEFNTVAVEADRNIKQLAKGANFDGTMTLNTNGAADAYETFVDRADGNTLENTLALDTNGAVAVYDALKGQIADQTTTLTIQADTTQTVSAFDAITAKASEIQGRGIYGDEAMIAGAAEFATYFSDAEAIMSMMDTLSNYAMGMTGGGGLDANAMVQYATDLGKITVGSYGAMTKKGFEFTDAQKAILDGTATQAQYIEALGAEYESMSDDMRAAAVINSVIAESWDGLYESMSNTPEGKIIQFNNSLGDIRETMGNQVYPAVVKFFEAFTGRLPQIETVMSGITSALSVVIQILTVIAGLGLDVATVFVENWSWIGPIIYGIAGALAVYYGARAAANGISIISKGIHLATAAAQMVQAAATGTLTAATAADIAAQNGLNAALYACPLVWIIMLVIALVAVFYAAVAAVNHFAGTSVSATGIICGVFMAALAFIGNLFVGLWNVAVDVFTLIYNLVAMVANFIGNVFTDPVGAVVHLFFDLADTVLGVLQTLAGALDAVFGSDLAGAVQGWRDSLGGWVNDTFGEQNEVMAKLNADDMKLDRFEYGAAFDAGYNFGEGIENKIVDVFKTPTLEQMGLDSLGAYDLGNQLDGITGNTGDTAANTAATADALDYAEEDLQYMRDIAEREAINRYTTAEIRVEQHNENHISSEMDLDGVMDAMTYQFAERLDISTEGVHP